MNDTSLSVRPSTAHATALILLTMPLGVLIAQIDTSVVNLAVKHIGANFHAGVNALQWILDAVSPRADWR